MFFQHRRRHPFPPPIPVPFLFSLSIPFLFFRPPTTRIRSTVSSPCSTRPTSTTTPNHPRALFPPIISLPFSSHFRRNTRPLSARSGWPPASSRAPRNPVNQNSTRKRGQMYTTRGARRTGCPERSPAAIDFRRLDGISAKMENIGVSFLGCLEGSIYTLGRF